MAAGGACGIVAGPVSAVELGDLNIQSSLGQPLRASIAYALNPHETLDEYCIYLRPGFSASGLPAITKARVSVADGVILLTSGQAIREPMLTMQVSVDCPYTAHISREYTLMMNPPQPTIEALATTSPPTPRATVAEPQAQARPEPQVRTQPESQPQARVERRRPVIGTPVAPRSRYQVQRGDSLSEIVARISDRSMALWPAVDLIFAANPQAFIDGDVNRLKAGAWLDIPDLSAGAPQPALAGSAQGSPPEPVAADQQVEAYGGYQSTGALESAVLIDPDAQVTDEGALEPASDFADLHPGDVAVGDQSPFVSPIGEPAPIAIPGDEFVAPAPVDPIAVVQTAPTDTVGDGRWDWLLWLGGTGLALILGLLLFGQTLRQRFGSVAIAAPAGSLPNRRRFDPEPLTSRAFMDVDFEVADRATMTLDADFDDGTGLDEPSDIDVAQDFGFSASSTLDEGLDLEFPESAVEEETSTDVIPPPERDDLSAILDSEIPPSDEEGEYDLSMIVDATKQTLDQHDATTKDLQAVPVDMDDITQSEEYTLNQEVDYKVLEQDYEDEFTATHALNAEIERAAAELAARMDIEASGEIATGLPRNTSAENDDVGVGEAPTVEMPRGDDVTVEMSINDEEATAEMEVESGKVDTKKLAS